jgi:hypothetical protein
MKNRDGIGRIQGTALFGEDFYIYVLHADSQLCGHRRLRGKPQRTTMAGFQEQLGFFDEPMRGFRIVRLGCMFVGAEQELREAAAREWIKEEFGVEKLAAEGVHYAGGRR